MARLLRMRNGSQAAPGAYCPARPRCRLEVRGGMARGPPSLEHPIPVAPPWTLPSRACSPNLRPTRTRQAPRLTPLVLGLNPAPSLASPPPPLDPSPPLPPSGRRQLTLREALQRAAAAADKAGADNSDDDDSDDDAAAAAAATRAGGMAGLRGLVYGADGGDGGYDEEAEEEVRPRPGLPALSSELCFVRACWTGSWLSSRVSAYVCC